MRETNIEANVDKCEFHITKTKFLKMIIERDEIKMNFEEVRTIMKWKKSTHLKKVQTFLEFVNFYRRFIKNFFKVAKSFVKFTRKDQLFSWFKDCQTTFDELKKRVIETSILSYFSSNLKTFLESDSSDYVSLEILSQKEDDNLIKSIFIFQRRYFLLNAIMKFTTRNY